VVSYEAKDALKRPRADERIGSCERAPPIAIHEPPESSPWTEWRHHLSLDSGSGSALLHRVAELVREDLPPSTRTCATFPASEDDMVTERERTGVESLRHAFRERTTVNANAPKLLPEARLEERRVR
jgi:hypothetical protein